LAQRAIARFIREITLKDANINEKGEASPPSKPVTVKSLPINIPEASQLEILQREKVGVGDSSIKRSLNGRSW
jgi:hypothetical protein